MDIKIKQIQTTKLIMTPQLIQSIDLLQMSILDLEKYLDLEVEKNPFIERIYPEYKRAPLNRSAMSTTEVIENTAKAETSDIYTHLLSQLPFMTEDKKVSEILEYMILNIDEAGYLNLNIEAAVKTLETSPAELERCRQELKWLEPCGVGAKDVAESLLWQGIKAFPEDVLFHDFIENHLQDVASQNWLVIADEMGVNEDQVEVFHQRLLSLNPRPISQYSLEEAYLVPDIIVTHDQDQQTVQVQLQDEFLPELNFNHAYFDEMTETKEVKQFKNENLHHYKQLIYSLTKRQTTLKDVALAILERQIAFLEKGFIALRPMTMKEIGQALTIHESTVSRAIRNKTIQTENGIFELRALFSKNLSSFGERNISQAMVKAKIKDWMKAEDPYQPLSDQKLVDLCAEEGITVSRRTITKYRQMMKIPSSTKRKMKKKE